MKKAGIIAGIILAIPTLWILLLLGIGFYSNETDNPVYWGKYQAVEYALSQPVFIIHDNGKDYLVPESKNTRCLGRHKLAPKSIAEFNSNPAKASKIQIGTTAINVNVKGVLDKGTLLRIKKIEKYTGFSLWSGYAEIIKPYGEILDGPFKGYMVNITDISIYYRDTDNSPFVYEPEQGIIHKRNEKVDPEKHVAYCN
jgi:hypothetical protein